MFFNIKTNVFISDKDKLTILDKLLAGFLRFMQARLIFKITSPINSEMVCFFIL